MASVPLPLSIEVVSDNICPFCFIGLRKLQRALAASPYVAGSQSRHAQNPPTFAAQIKFKPFQLDPTLSANAPVDKRERYLQKFGPQFEQMEHVMKARGQEVGINFAYEGKLRNTTVSHRLMEKAFQTGGWEQQLKLINKLFPAYFENAQDIGDKDLLATFAVDSGIFPTKDAARSFLDSDELLSEVQKGYQEAVAQQISGVPNFTITALRPETDVGQSTAAVPGAESNPGFRPFLRSRVAGAQDPETFVNLIEQMAKKAASKGLVGDAAKQSVLLRGFVDAASVAANLTKVLTTAASSASSAPLRHQQQQPRPWPTQAPLYRQTDQIQAQSEAEEVEEQEPVIYTLPSSQPLASTSYSPSEPAVAPPPVSESLPEAAAPSAATASARPPPVEPEATSLPASPPLHQSEAPPSSSSLSATAQQPKIDPEPETPKRDPLPTQEATSASSQPSAPPPPPSSPQPITGSPSQSQPRAQPTEDEYDPENIPRSTPLRAAKVPSSRLGRLMHYGSLGAGLAWGAAGQYLAGSSSSGSSPFMGEANLRRLVDKLSTMRGAALKLGQFMSIQDSHMLPPELEEVLLRVQNSANYMPEWQMEKVMTEDLGPDWRSHFDHFNSTPFAAASIGQVHSATLSSSYPDSRLAGSKVAVKVQFPGIKQSIASDLGYLTSLLTASALLPKGLFLQSTIKTMRGELEDECDYAREAEMGRRFARLVHESNEAGSGVEGVMPFAVPRVVDELCTGRVLTTEMMRGRPLTQAARYSQERRNAIATSILRLCLQELFHFRLMQTDPNWSNFLLNERTSTLELLDFGATRDYTPEFIDKWYHLLSAAVRGDRDACLEWSHKIGYLTGEESEGMLEAHLQSMLLLAEPFSAHAPSPYNFTNQTITTRVRTHIPVMLKERKTPPPKETYSLNRKLSGAFLLCAKLGAEVRCKEVWEEVLGSYKPLAPVPSAPASAVGGSNARLYHSLAHPGLRTGIRTRPEKTTRCRPQPSILLHHPHLRARLRHPSANSLTSMSGLGHSALCPFSSSARSPDGVPSYELRQNSLDLRSTWAKTVPQPKSRSALARLDLPPDPLGINSSNPPTTDSISATTPVLGPNKQAEEAMKAALVGDGSPEKRSKIAIGNTIPSDATSSAAAPSNTAGPEGPKPVIIRGVAIPRKPPPPGPEDCCMSGCAHCTYDIYADAIQEYLSELSHAQSQLAALSSPPMSDDDWAAAAALGIKRADPPAVAARGGGGAAGEGKEAEEDRAQREVDEAVRNIEDPTLRAFLDMERKLKKRQREREREKQAGVQA
ncbi:hypothetical protein OC845_002522 [Tilletia horrida]|nr:hypothetical protein OC845_002522 [Tilletia horrida]